MPKEHEVTMFRTDVALREKSSDSMFSDKLRFIYLSLPFFDKSEEECETGCLSSEEQEKYDESIKAVDDYYSGLYDFASDYEGYRIE